MCFFSPRVVVLKMTIIKEANVRVLPSFTIMIKYDQIIIFYWSSQRLRSNDCCFLLFSNKLDFLEI